jgi:hypothetical protein
MGARLRRLEKYPAWATFVVGFCVFALRYASPRPSFGVHRNLFFTGLVVMIAALAAVIANEGDAPANYWSLINVLSGFWLIASATFIPAVAFVSAGQTILGVVLVLLAFAILAIQIASHYMRET